jgi:hypothetical protein
VLDNLGLLLKIEGLLDLIRWGNLEITESERPCCITGSQMKLNTNMIDNICFVKEGQK